MLKRHGRIKDFKSKDEKLCDYRNLLETEEIIEEYKRGQNYDKTHRTGHFFLGQKSERATRSDLQIGRDLQDTLRAKRERCVGMAVNMIGYKKNIIIVNMGVTIQNRSKHLLLRP